uniref:RNA polymerase-associated protein LEO1 n=1 Tax=Romanomermis culicivorax TaxID=13658 RepID=A0A915K3W9_ROMCU
MSDSDFTDSGSLQETPIIDELEQIQKTPGDDEGECETATFQYANNRQEIGSTPTQHEYDNDDQIEEHSTTMNAEQLQEDDEEENSAVINNENFDRLQDQDDEHSEAMHIDDEREGEQPSDDVGLSKKIDGDDGFEEAEEESDRQPSRAHEEEGENQIDDMPTQEDLFGDADDVSTSDEEQKSEAGGDKSRQGSTSPSHIQANERPNQDQEEEQEEEIAETLIDVEIPKISADLGSQLHFVKFPNFLSVEPRPFDPDTYEDEIDDDDVLDEEGRSRVKLKVENTIRWRNDPNDESKRLSNAKIVRWSDGSMSLYLGAEVFDVHTHPLQGDHHHLFIRQGTGLQGRAIFRTKLTFRPHSTESFTHRKITMSMADRTNKTQKVKVLPAVGKDPEAQKQELMKKEEERLRASARRESQQRRKATAGHGRSGLSASYLEPDRESDEENTVSISAIKKSFKAGGKDFAAARAIYASSDEDEDAEDDDDDALENTGNNRRAKNADRPTSTKAERQLERAKRVESDDDEKGSDAGETERRRAHIIEDDDEE